MRYRPIEQRHFTPSYDVNGKPIQRLSCVYPDKETHFPSGRTIKYYPILIFEPDNPTETPCQKTGNTAPEGARGQVVPKNMCDLQIELGTCPLGRRR